MYNLSKTHKRLKKNVFKKINKLSDNAKHATFLGRPLHQANKPTNTTITLIMRKMKKVNNFFLNCILILSCRKNSPKIVFGQQHLMDNLKSQLYTEGRISPLS